MWGAELHCSEQQLVAACRAEGVWPYLVVHPQLGFLSPGKKHAFLSGFRISPAMDVDEEQLREGLSRLARVLERLRA